MNMTPDQILDRLNLKKKATYWRGVALVCLLILGVSFFSDQDFGTVPVMDGGYIARVSFEGPLVDDVGKLQHLKTLADDKAVKGVVLYVNSPGGTVVGGESLYRAMRKVANAKPVAVVMGDIAASGGYMLAIAADYLVAYETTVTGSIGVLGQSFEVTELAEKLGVRFHNFKSSPLKGGPLPTERLTHDMEVAMHDTIKDIYDMFVDLVSMRRNIPKDKLLPLADGRVYTGRQALAFGLIDAIGDEDTAIEWLVTMHTLDRNLKVRDYEIEQKESPLDKLLGGINSATRMVNMILSNRLIYFF